MKMLARGLARTVAPFASAFAVFCTGPMAVSAQADRPQQEASPGAEIAALCQRLGTEDQCRCYVPWATHWVESDQRYIASYLELVVREKDRNDGLLAAYLRQHPNADKYDVMRLGLARSVQRYQGLNADEQALAQRIGRANFDRIKSGFGFYSDRCKLGEPPSDAQRQATASAIADDAPVLHRAQ
jgi:hypothetical protein